MKDYHINIFYSEEDEEYIADIPDLKFCSAFGETPEEALREVQIAKLAWLEVARTEGNQEGVPTITDIAGEFPSKASEARSKCRRVIDHARPA